MAAYAALVSLMHIIKQIQHHPRPPISLDKKQVESLIEKVTFFQDFLESYSNGGSEDADALEGRIADAAYAAEDIIESHIVHQIQAGSTSTHVENISGSTEFYLGLQKVIENMDFIKTEVTEIKLNLAGIQDQLLHINSMSAGSSRSSPTGQNTTVGFDDVLIEMMDKLTGQQSNRQIIPIVGMGGIGKTTLARNIYVNPLIVQHFDFRGWATISQEYNVQEILLEVFLCVETKGNKESLSQMSEHELGEKLYKSLSGRRYLIVMDDIWRSEAWDTVVVFFPDNNNRSRIIITTRVSNLAFELGGCCGLEMNFLDEDKSWNLLCKTAFVEEDCPTELGEIGKKIAKNCKGLPLSIVVIGGLLAKSKRTPAYWQYIAENLNSIVNLEDNENCLKILCLSYNQLPAHLKPCFLYMGMFPEDSNIHVSDLIKLWVAEGFLKPISNKSLEAVAEEYFNNLVDRNLILVRQRGSTGKIKLCIIHDLLRDLCLREAEKQKFLYVTRQHSNIHTQRRIAIHRSVKVVDCSHSVPLIARSLVCKCSNFLPILNFRLLRVLNWSEEWSQTEHFYPPEDIFQLVNSRYIAMPLDPYNLRFPSSIYLLWNLQTLIVTNYLTLIAPSEIWMMPQVRHVQFDDLELPDPPSGHMDDQYDDDIVLGNLQTLLRIYKFKFSEEVVKRIPNIKKLQVYYEGFDELQASCYCLNNLGRLLKLESLTLSWSASLETGLSRTEMLQLQNLTFPHSLKKLTLDGNVLHSEDMMTKIGSLPLLQVLKLKRWSFKGPEWETVEGQFCSLKFLLISYCIDLEYWTTDSTHFPRLEHLVLQELYKFKEIPSAIGDIPTLQSIELEFCTDSAIISARKIVEEQDELGNVGLQVRVQLCNMNKVLEKSLASRNVQVTTQYY